MKQKSVPCAETVTQLPSNIMVLLNELSCKRAERYAVGGQFHEKWFIEQSCDRGSPPVGDILANYLSGQILDSQKMGIIFATHPPSF